MVRLGKPCRRQDDSVMRENPWRAHLGLPIPLADQTAMDSFNLSGNPEQEYKPLCAHCCAHFGARRLMLIDARLNHRVFKDRSKPCYLVCLSRSGFTLVAYQATKVKPLLREAWRLRC